MENRSLKTPTYRTAVYSAFILTGGAGAVIDIIDFDGQWGVGLAILTSIVLAAWLVDHFYLNYSLFDHT